MLEKLMQSPVAWAILSMVTIVSLPLAIYSIVTSKKRKEISYVGKSYCIVEKGKKKLSNFELLYKGKGVSDISITQYAIWNSGNQLLNRQDIVSEQPIRIVAHRKDQILDVHIVTESEESNKFSAVLENNVVTIGFDYVAANEGIALQVIHTGSRNSMSFEGKIKGGNPIKCKEPKSRFALHKLGDGRTEKRIARMICILTGVLFVGGIALTLGSFIDTPQLDASVNGLRVQALREIRKKAALSVGLLSMFTGGLYFLIFGGVMKDMLGIGIPQKLRGYTENTYYN